MQELIFGAINKALDFGTSILNFFSKGKLDVTEIEKAKLDVEKLMAQLDFSKLQMQIWVQQSLIDMEKATGAKWRTPLILVNGIALVIIAVNNILASVYLSWAHPVPLASTEIGLLAGMFVLLVVGDPKVLLDVFSKKEVKPTAPVVTKEK
jgi:hypothetical protein